VSPSLYFITTSLRDREISKRLVKADEQVCEVDAVGIDEYCGALSKSNSTACAEAADTNATTLKKNKVMQAVRIKLHFPNIDSIDFFKYKVFILILIYYFNLF
jgi:hypothetical protein